jgi:hemolysin D
VVWASFGTIDIVATAPGKIVPAGRTKIVQPFAAIAETRNQADSEHRRALFDDLTKAEQKAAGFTQDVIKADRRSALQLITAPVDGVVQQLAVHTVGGIVTPAQPLSRGGAERQPSRDRGDGVEPRRRLRACGSGSRNQGANLQFHEIRAPARQGPERVSRRHQPNDKSRGGDNRMGAPENEDPVYAARITLDQTQMQVEDQLVNLSPGMAVTAEIKTGSRTVISYLLSPLRKYRQESLRER